MNLCLGAESYSQKNICLETAIISEKGIQVAKGFFSFFCSAVSYLRLIQHIGLRIGSRCTWTSFQTKCILRFFFWEQFGYTAAVTSWLDAVFGLINHWPLRYFSSAAEAGHAGAFAFLGKMYLDGTHVTPQDNTTAFNFFLRSADKVRLYSNWLLGTGSQVGFLTGKSKWTSRSWCDVHAWKGRSQRLREGVPFVFACCRAGMGWCAVVSRGNVLQ